MLRSGRLPAGDLLLLFTDGLTDNLHWHEVWFSVFERDASRVSSSFQSAWPGVLVKLLHVVA